MNYYERLQNMSNDKLNALYNQLSSGVGGTGTKDIHLLRLVEEVLYERMESHDIENLHE